jgi:TPR repeat/Glycosyltransferase family 9 (heptosyltransferase)
MNSNELIEQGNQLRAQQEPEQALACYAQAFTQDPDSAAAFNNYGNVMRELGYPARAIPFLQHAAVLDPRNITTRFNLAVTYLLKGDYAQGWPAYEARWDYEHLAGTEPKFSQPRWRGEELAGKIILVVGEQGHGDNIQFVRFLWNLHAQGARVKLQVTDGLVPLLSLGGIISQVGKYTDDMGEFDYWVPIMSIPGILGITLDTLPRVQSYLNADPVAVRAWQQRLGPKTRMRVGFCWSGRPDSWLNQHKAVPFETMLDLIKSTPEYEWVNLQVDASDEQEAELAAAGVTRYPGSVHSFADTAALMQNLDVVVGVDTAVSHLAGALGRPVWIMLNAYATDWRWLMDRDSSPWYSTARLFRQPRRGDWASVTKKVAQYLSWFKV